MRRPPCFILPPHIVRSIAERGSPGQRRRAISTIELSQTIRARRELLSRSPPRGAACALERQVTVFDAHHRERPPFSRVRGERDAPLKDKTVNEAFDGAASTFALYLKAFDRCSVDGKGLPLDSIVHFARDYDNAFWDGQQMVYGDGDRELFNRFTCAVDVIGHELTHGVTQFEAGLDYADEPGALNESFSDVFGSIVKQFTLKQKAGDADWLIGAGLFTKAVRGRPCGR